MENLRLDPQVKEKIGKMAEVTCRSGGSAF